MGGFAPPSNLCSNSGAGHRFRGTMPGSLLEVNIKKAKSCIGGNDGESVAISMPFLQAIVMRNGTKPSLVISVSAAVAKKRKLTSPAAAAKMHAEAGAFEEQASGDVPVTEFQEGQHPSGADSDPQIHDGLSADLDVGVAEVGNGVENAHKGGVDEHDENDRDPASIQKLLEPFPKDHIIELLRDAAVKHPDLLSEIHRIADLDPPIARSSSTASVGTPALRFLLLLFARPVPPPAPQVSDNTQRKIFVSNVGAELDPQKLLQFFSKYGEVEEGPLGLDKKAIDGPKPNKPGFQFHGSGAQHGRLHHGAGRMFGPNLPTSDNPPFFSGVRSLLSSATSAGHLMAPSSSGMGFKQSIQPAGAMASGLNPAFGQALTAWLATHGSGLGLTNIPGNFRSSGVSVNYGMMGGYGSQGHAQGGYGNSSTTQGSSARSQTGHGQTGGLGTYLGR
ncbi:hypothetical protein ZIOFF_066171 [Zingiber officinale]|uniref:RRM domain-containing protein n=1 Tax=Zingiber officinale TaxID=94328 RepID=A0A8J5F2D4_ZINOF|nr:hypothetical protein ZIOFF_066171 [Zingiber officinale]